jgi:hypothetical protein
VPKGERDGVANAVALHARSLRRGLAGRSRLAVTGATTSSSGPVVITGR